MSHLPPAAALGDHIQVARRRGSPRWHLRPTEWNQDVARPQGCSALRRPNFRIRCWAEAGSISDREITWLQCGWRPVYQNWTSYKEPSKKWKWTWTWTYTDHKHGPCEFSWLTGPFNFIIQQSQCCIVGGHTWAIITSWQEWPWHAQHIPDRDRYHHDP